MQRSAARVDSCRLSHPSPLSYLETKRQCAHFSHIERATTRPKEFKKPAHWSDDPPPKPQPLKADEEDPQGLSPTRYGDWVKDGIAIDF